MNSTNENLSQSQIVPISARHLLACEDETGKPDPDHRSGFCVIVYAVQDLNRLDAFVRRNLHFIIYKTYYESLERELDGQSLQFLKEVTESAIYRHNYSARSFCLMKTLTNSVLKLYIPKTEANIEILYSDGPNHQEIIDHVMKLDLDEVKDSIVRGYIKEFCASRKIKLESNEINEIIEISRYQQWKLKQQQGKEQEDRAQDSEDTDNCNEDITLQKAVCAWLNDVYAKTRDFRINNKDMYQAFPLENPGTLRSIKMRWAKKKRKKTNRATVRRKAPTIKEE